jgi:dipeptidyl aminopeptidase/acylaminoacyl peptidase
MEKPIVFKRDSLQLVGILHLPFERKTNKKFPAVIFCHGFSGNKSEAHFIFTRLARALSNSGIVCLRFDFMGSGDSYGNFEDMTLETEMKDALSAFNYLTKKPYVDIKRVGVIGLSMGAIPASYLASLNLVSALCIWSGLAFPVEISQKILTRKMKKILQSKGKIHISGYVSGLKLGRKFFDSLETVDPLSFVSNFKGTGLIIHCADDHSIDLKHPFAYYRAMHKSSTSRKLLILPEGGHTFVTEKSENAVISETVAFFSEVL